MYGVEPSDNPARDLYLAGIASIDAQAAELVRPDNLASRTIQYLAEQSADRGENHHNESGSSGPLFHVTAGDYFNPGINSYTLFGDESLNDFRVKYALLPDLNVYGQHDLYSLNYWPAMELGKQQAGDAQWQQTKLFLTAPIVLPTTLSGISAIPFGLRYLGGELTAFASAPGAYTTTTVVRLTPYVDEFAYGLMGMPGGMTFGVGATVGTATVLGRAGDDLLGYGYQYGDDLGRLGLYGRGADDLNIPQLNVYGWADDPGRGYWGGEIFPNGISQPPSSLSFELTQYAQQLADEGYDLADAAARNGFLRITGAGRQAAIGTYVDDYIKFGLQERLAAQGIQEGAGEVVELNRWLRDPVGSGAYRRPDLRIEGESFILDYTISGRGKWLTSPQISDFYKFSGGDTVTILRPSQVGGSYTIIPHNYFSVPSR